MPRRCPLFPTVLAVLACATATAAAESLAEMPEPHYFQVRATDPRIVAALERGLRRSATFRELVLHINVSDVVVYVCGDGSPGATGLDGRLTCLSAIGGYRYVVVRVNVNLSIPRLAAVLGGPARAAEIADARVLTKCIASDPRS